MFLNTIRTQCPIYGDDSDNIFTHLLKDDRLLPEDYIRQGLLYGSNYLPKGYLNEAGIDQDEQEIESPSMVSLRMQRILYLGKQIALVRFPSAASYPYL